MVALEDKYTASQVGTLFCSCGGHLALLAPRCLWPFAGRSWHPRTIARDHDYFLLIVLAILSFLKDLEASGSIGRKSFS